MVKQESREKRFSISCQKSKLSKTLL